MLLHVTRKKIEDQVHKFWILEWKTHISSISQTHVDVILALDPDGYQWLVVHVPAGLVGDAHPLLVEPEGGDLAQADVAPPAGQDGV